MDTPLEALITSFGRSLAAARKSPNTAATYLRSSHSFSDWLTEHTDVTDWGAVTRRHIEGWLLARQEAGGAPGYVNNQYRGVQALFKWLEIEGEIQSNIMVGMSPPAVGEKVVPIVPTDDIKVLLKSCAGRDFVDRRDLAILRLFVSTGMRLAELAGLKVDDIDLDNRLALVTGKGDRQRIVRFDHETAMALDRYLRLRAREKYARRPEFWLAEKNRGILKRNGVYQMVVRRGEGVGLDINPHQFRHTFSHRYLAAGGAEGDLMEQNGWRSPQMLRRYGASARAERARTAYDRVDVMGDI
jgi:integrase/recombinase XerD